MQISLVERKGMNSDYEAPLSDGKAIKLSVRGSRLTIQNQEEFSEYTIWELCESLLDEGYVYFWFKGKLVTKESILKLKPKQVGKVYQFDEAEARATA